MRSSVVSATWCRLQLLALGVGLLTGCGDAIEDPTGLVGEWEKVPAVFWDDPPEEIAILEHDGAYTWSVEDEETRYGTWSASGQTLRRQWTDDEGLQDVAADYVLVDDTMLVGAMFPVGLADGPVGRWHGESTANDEFRESSYEFFPDGTATYETSATDSPPLITGTWREDGPDLVFTFMEGDQRISVYNKQFRGVAIGWALFERIR